MTNRKLFKSNFLTFQKPINKKVRFYYAKILINAKMFLLKGVER